jgi:hypothetical protein
MGQTKRVAFVDYLCEPVQKKVNRRKRRSTRRTSENLSTIRKFDARQQAVTPMPLVLAVLRHALLPLETYNSQRPNPSSVAVMGEGHEATPDVIDQNPNVVWLPAWMGSTHYVKRRRGRPRLPGSWAETMDPEKIIFANRAIADIGGTNAFAFSLDLNPNVEYEAKRGFDNLRRKIVLLLGSSRPAVMTLGMTDDGRLHVHGSVVTSGPDDLAAVREALKQAGGEWANTYGARFQLEMKVLGSTGPVDGWGDYLNKSGREAKRIKGIGLVSSMTNTARARAKELYKEVRRAIRDEHKATRRLATNVPTRLVMIREAA